MSTPPTRLAYNCCVAEKIGSCCIKTECSHPYLPRSPTKIRPKQHGSTRVAMEIELQGQISRLSVCPDPFGGSLPAFPRTRSGTLQTTQKNDSTVKFTRTTFIENNAMSASERTPAAESSPKIEYTVTQTAKIHREKQQDSRSSVWLSVAKWIGGIFLFASVLTCLVASKISLLSMASFRWNTNVTDTQKKDPKQNQETLFIMIVLLLMIPEGYSFLMACWTSLFSKNHKWPCKKAIILVRTFSKVTLNLCLRNFVKFKQLLASRKQF